MKRVALLLVLAAVAVPAAAPGAGCSPLDCSPTGSTLGRGLFALRPQGLTGYALVDDLRTGKTKWRLPAGILAGTTLVHQAHYSVTWFDARTGKRTHHAVVKSGTAPSLVGVSQDGARAVLQYDFNKQTTLFLVSPSGQRLVRLPSYSWSFDALAGTNLYLLHYLRGGYEVRRYDLATGTLAVEPLKSPDDSAVISGSPWSRLSSRDGRYLFTLYVDRDHAMVHELDVRNATARCIDLPGRGNSNLATSYSMQLSPDGRTLWAVSPGYGRVAAIDVLQARVRSEFGFNADPLTEAPNSPVSAISADGARLAVAAGGGLWVIDPARRVVVLHSKRAATALAFSPDGTMLWAARGAVMHAVRLPT